MPCSGEGCAIPACIAGDITACLATGLQGGAWSQVGAWSGGCLVLGVPGPGGAWTGGCLVWGVPGPGGCLVQGVPGLGGCLLRGDAWSGGGGGLLPGGVGGGDPS